MQHCAPRVSVADMLKFSAFVYHYHQPPDVKLLFNHVLRRGREFLEKVRSGGSRGTGVYAEPRVAPTVVCPQARSAVYWQKSAAAWKNLVSGYLARNQSEGFAARFAKNCHSQWVFGTWRQTSGYGGLARRIAMYGFVGVAISSNGQWQHDVLHNPANDGIYSAIRVSACMGCYKM